MRRIMCAKRRLRRRRSGLDDALMTGTVNKASIARRHLPRVRGHTNCLAESCGLERYGRDYLMACLGPDL